MVDLYLWLSSPGDGVLGPDNDTRTHGEVSHDRKQYSSFSRSTADATDMHFDLVIAAEY